MQREGENYSFSYGRLLLGFCAQTVKESSCNTGDLGSIPGSGRSFGEGNGNPLQHSCLENSTDREAEWATSLVGTELTRLSDSLTHTHTHIHTHTPRKGSDSTDWEMGVGSGRGGTGQVKRAGKERPKLPPLFPPTPPAQKLVILSVCPPQASQNHLYPCHLTSQFAPPSDVSVSSPLSGMGSNKVFAQGFLLLADEDRHNQPSGSKPSRCPAKSPLLHKHHSAWPHQITQLSTLPALSLLWASAYVGPAAWEAFSSCFHPPNAS